MSFDGLVSMLPTGLLRLFIQVAAEHLPTTQENVIPAPL